MGLEENAVIHFLRKLDAAPFLVNYQGTQYKIGEGEPTFTVNINKELDIKDLMTSTSLALGEAYMRGDLTMKATCTKRWRTSWDRWTVFHGYHQAEKADFHLRLQEEPGKRGYLTL